MKCSKISRFIILYFPISVKVWYHITIPGDRGRFSVSFRKTNKINYCEKETGDGSLSPSGKSIESTIAKRRQRTVPCLLGRDSWL